MVQPETTQSGDTELLTGDGGRERWLVMYEQMLKIRLFEEHVNQLYLTAKMPGLAHLYIGEEAIAVGVCQALQRMIILPARTVDMDTVWQKVLLLTLCLLNSWQRGWLLSWQRRFHAYCRPGYGQSRCQCDRGRECGHCNGAAMSSKMHGNKQGDGLFLW